MRRATAESKSICCATRCYRAECVIKFQFNFAPAHREIKTLNAGRQVCVMCAPFSRCQGVASKRRRRSGKIADEASACGSLILCSVPSVNQATPYMVIGQQAERRRMRKNTLSRWHNLFDGGGQLQYRPAKIKFFPVPSYNDVRLLILNASFFFFCVCVCARAF